MTYRPNPDSLAALVVGFFALNPGEELALDDVIAKFVTPGDSRNVHTQLIAALDHDMLAWDPDEEVYRKGAMNMPAVRGPDDSIFQAESESHAVVDIRRGRKNARAVPDHQGGGAGQDPGPHAEGSGGAGAIPGGEVGGRWPELGSSWHREMGRPAQRDDPQGIGHGRSGPGLEASLCDRVGGDQRTGARRDGAVCAEQATPSHAGEPGPCDAGGAEEAHAQRATGLGDSAADGWPAVQKSGDDWQVQRGLEESRHSGMGEGARVDPTGLPARPQGLGGAGCPGEPCAVPGGGVLRTHEDFGDAGASQRAAGNRPPEGGDHQADQKNDQGQRVSVIATVRQHLLDTLADLRNKQAPMDIARAKAVADVATVLVNSAKVEVDYLRVTQQRSGQFFESLPAPDRSIS